MSFRRSRTTLVVFFLLGGIRVIQADDKPPSSQPPALGGLTLSSGTASSPIATSSSTSVAESSATLPSPKALPDESALREAKIVNIHVEGNRNVRERAVLAKVKTRKGDPYNAEALRKDVQSIYSMGNFDDVTVDVTEIPNGVAVLFRVSEKPEIKKIDLKGNKKLSNMKIRDALTLKEGDPFDKMKQNLDIEKVMSLYKDEGFAAAQVESFTSVDATNHVTVTFFITEGTQVLIDQVDLQGVTSFPTKKILKLMKSRRKKVFKQDVLTKDLEEVTKFYKNHGYQNIKIGEVKQVFNADKTRLTLLVPIEEGPLLHFNDTRFSGNTIFNGDKLASQLQFKKGDIFNQEKLDATLSKLQDLYGAQGYIRVQIKPNFSQDAAKETVDIEFQINEGEVVYVDHIGVEGNTHTKDYVIRREILLKEGDPFSSVKARKSVERLYNLGFLDNVDVDVQQPVSPAKADVIFTVTEGKPGVLSAGAGFSSIDGLIGTLQVQHINFLGRGQRLNVQAQFGGRLQSYDVGWSEPWFLGKPMTLGTDLFDTTRIQQYGTNRNAYTTHDLGGSLTAGPRFSDIYSLLFTYSIAERRRFDIAEISPGVKDPVIQQAVLGTIDPTITDKQFLTSNFTEQLIRDTRDNQFDPTHGNRISFGVTEGGLFPANAIKYYKPIVDESIHIPTFWKLVLSLHARWALIKPYGGSTLDDIVDELFYVGGSDAVRGYDRDAVGVPTGGQVENVYNVEYKFPIAPDEHGRTLLQGVFFYDIGGSWNNIHDVSYQVNTSDRGLKQGVGFGIRFKTPVFPLRLDWAIPLNLAPGQTAQNFNFSIGSLF